MSRELLVGLLGASSVCAFITYGVVLLKTAVSNRELAQLQARSVVATAASSLASSPVVVAQSLYPVTCWSSAPFTDAATSVLQREVSKTLLRYGSSISPPSSMLLRNIALGVVGSTTTPTDSNFSAITNVITDRFSSLAFVCFVVPVQDSTVALLAPRVTASASLTRQNHGPPIARKCIVSDGGVIFRLELQAYTANGAYEWWWASDLFLELPPLPSQTWRHLQHVAFAMNDVSGFGDASSGGGEALICCDPQKRQGKSCCSFVGSSAGALKGLPEARPIATMLERCVPHDHTAFNSENSSACTHSPPAGWTPAQGPYACDALGHAYQPVLPGDVGSVIVAGIFVIDK